MKRTIRGTIYNTEKAIVIGSYSHLSGDSLDQWENWTATLFKIPRRTRVVDTYFLYGQGGPMTRWAVHTPNHTDAEWKMKNEIIIPLSKETAQQWALNYLNLKEI